MGYNYLQPNSSDEVQWQSDPVHFPAPVWEVCRYPLGPSYYAYLECPVWGGTIDFGYWDLPNGVTVTSVEIYITGRQEVGDPFEMTFNYYFSVDGGLSWTPLGPVSSGFNTFWEQKVFLIGGLSKPEMDNFLFRVEYASGGDPGDRVNIREVYLGVTYTGAPIAPTPDFGTYIWEPGYEDLSAAKYVGINSPAGSFVMFRNLSSGVVHTTEWDFGDGGGFVEWLPEYDASYNYMYGSVGNKTVAIRASNWGGSNTLVKLHHVVVTNVQIRTPRANDVVEWTPPAGVANWEAVDGVGHDYGTFSNSNTSDVNKKDIFNSCLFSETPIWDITEDIGGGTAYAIAYYGGHIYVVGYGADGNILEKRNLSDGSLVWQQIWKVGGTNVYNVLEAIAIDSSGIYVVGETGSDWQHVDWRIEQRSLTDGSLVQGLSVFGDYLRPRELKGIAIDGTYLYVIGDNDTSTSYNTVTIQKRRMSDLGLEWSQTEARYSGINVPKWDIFAYDTYVYHTTQITGGVGYIRKRNKSDGSIVWSQAFPAASLPNGIIADLSGVYVIGDYSSGGKWWWRIEKRNHDGTLAWGRGFKQHGINSPTWGRLIDIDTDYIYAGGICTNGTNQWLLEKRNKSDGEAIWKYDIPAGLGYGPYALCIDADNVYSCGDDSGGYWRIQKFAKVIADIPIDVQVYRVRIWLGGYIGVTPTSCKFDGILKIGGIDYSKELSADYFYYAVPYMTQFFEWDKNPVTSLDWTPAEVNAIDLFGYQTHSSIPEVTKYAYDVFLEILYSSAPPPPTPTLDEIMRGGKWFQNGVFKGCWLGWR